LKQEKCPLCGSNLVVEIHQVRKGGDGSGSMRYDGSIDILTGGSLNVTRVKTVYRCPNPECGYLNTDC
jgi:predicted RNA-binding Zn-ribbon protein involved in translation (DUF1610 family)